MLEYSLLGRGRKKFENFHKFLVLKDSISISNFDVNKQASCCSINPKPHGSGWICPHSFQRPITQKVLKLKKSAKNTYSTENLC
jgi:hypothetical protein